MNVFVVVGRVDSEGDYVMGVFSTRAIADTWIASHKDQFRYYHAAEIIEFELDGPLSAERRVSA